MDFLKRFIWKDCRGAVAVEFAIIVSVYILFVFSCLEFGYVLWANSTLNYGAVCGARQAYISPTSSNTTIENYILNKINFPNNVISYTVTMSSTAADIKGSFTYKFIVLPLAPVTVSTQIYQLFPTNT